MSDGSDTSSATMRGFSSVLAVLEDVDIVGEPDLDAAADRLVGAGDVEGAVGPGREIGVDQGGEGEPDQKLERVPGGLEEDVDLHVGGDVVGLRETARTRTWPRQARWRQARSRRASLPRARRTIRRRSPTGSRRRTTCAPDAGPPRDRPGRICSAIASRGRKQAPIAANGLRPVSRGRVSAWPIEIGRPAGLPNPAKGAQIHFGANRHFQAASIEL